MIEHTYGDRISLGEPDGSRSPRAEALSKLMIAAGIKAPVRPRIRDEIWVKLWGNSGLQPDVGVDQRDPRPADRAGRAARYGAGDDGRGPGRGRGARRQIRHRCRFSGSTVPPKSAPIRPRCSRISNAAGRWRSMRCWARWSNWGHWSANRCRPAPRSWPWCANGRGMRGAISKGAIGAELTPTPKPLPTRGRGFYKGPNSANEFPPFDGEGSGGVIVSRGPLLEPDQNPGPLRPRYFSAVCCSSRSALAGVWPELGKTDGLVHLEYYTNYGVSVVFLLYGLTLSWDRLRAGMLNWRLHLVVLSGTFIIYPALVWGAGRAGRLADRQRPQARLLLPGGLALDDLVLGRHDVDRARQCGRRDLQRQPVEPDRRLRHTALGHWYLRRRARRSNSAR